MVLCYWENAGSINIYLEFLNNSRLPSICESNNVTKDFFIFKIVESFLGSYIYRPVGLLHICFRLFVSIPLTLSLPKLN